MTALTPSPDRAGVRLPRTDDGSRSSSTFGRAVLADSLRGVDAGLAERVQTASGWRKGYPAHFAAATRASAQAKDALVTAEDGLRAALDRGVHVDGGGGETPLTGWSRPDPVGQALGERVVEGRGERLTRVEVPYRGETLHGTALERRLDAWVEAGTVEAGFADSVRRAIAHPEWLALPGHRAVLLGAGAAMGPLPWLTRWGADVVAVDVDDERVWRRLNDLAEAGSGRLTAPQQPDRDRPGADLTADLAVLHPWLAARWSTDGLAPVLSTLVYADGARHVELTLAADVLAQDVATTTDGVLAYLNTPTDSFLVPADAVAQSAQRRGERSWNGLAHRGAALVSGRRLFQPAYDGLVSDEHGGQWGVIDTLVDVQGPNYALAKRIQRWRGVVNRHAGHRTSSTVAPASWTRSVTKNRVLAAAYAGAHRFGVEIFDADTAAALLATKLVADVFDDVDHRDEHPEALFSSTAAHGGLWRQPFDPRSALGVSALLGLPRTLLSRR